MTAKKALIIVSVLLVSTAMLFAQSFSKSEEWVTFDDKVKGGTSTINKNAGMVTIDGKEVVAVTMTGEVTTKFQYGYTGVTADEDPVTVAALKEATGITFYTKGDGKKYRVRVETSDVKDANFHGFVFTAPKGKMVQVTVPFKKLTQETWGATKKFNAANASRVSFQTMGQPISSFEFTIADLKPYK